MDIVRAVFRKQMIQNVSVGSFLISFTRANAIADDL